MLARDPASKEKTTFITYSGLHELHKMPFECTSNVPASDRSRLAQGSCHVYIDRAEKETGKTQYTHQEQILETDSSGDILGTVLAQ